jgi:radical SAM protein with 4Fe4S-binding SPASM domain
LKIKLKPYVHKVKGAKNYALYDLLKGNFYTIIPDGDVEQLKMALKEAGLTFETDGIVPFKINIGMTQEKNSIKIRELQIRINGRIEDNCWNRNKLNKNIRIIQTETLAALKEKISHVHVQNLHIEAESYDQEKIEYILEGFPYKQALLIVEEGLKKEEHDQIKKICNIRKTGVTFLTDGKKDLKTLKVEIFDFFYNQHFNPCLGQQLAVDCGGEIKPCLWWHEILGDIKKDNIISMINIGIFDKYWECSKDKINVCKDCELRYACLDCRLSHHDGEDNFTEKPTYCSYNPYVGNIGL